MRFISALFSVLAVVAGVFSHVPAPEHVTVSCHNFQTTVHWNYSELHPQTSFKLIIGGSAGKKEKRETDKHLYNLTSFVWEFGKDRFTAFHSVKVSATEGKNESKMVEKTFSFNDLKTAEIQCYFDFPPVELSVNDLKATVTFPNPHHYYERLKQADSTLGFTVHLLNDTDNYGQQMNYSMTCEEIHCIERFDVPEMDNYCITLDGRMAGPEGNYGFLFKKADPLCARTLDSNTVQDTSHIMVVAVVLSVFGIGLLVVAFVIVKSEAWKTIPSHLPKALEPIVSSINRNVMNVPYESVSTISVTEPDFDESDSSLMVVTAEETDRSATQTERSGSDPSSPKPIGSATYMEGGLSESSNQQECKETMPTPETNESERCSEEDSAPEEERSSGYDRPHKLMDVDMGHGDVVKSYNR